MKTLHIIVANKIATYSQRGGDIVCGNSDYQIEFTFDDEWAAYAQKTARFIWNGKYKDVVFSGTVCPVPIVANTDRLEIGVYAEDLCTTTSAVIACRRSILCNSDVKSEGTVVVPEGTPVLVEKTFNANGEYPAKNYGADGFSKVKINVPTESANTEVETCTMQYISGNVLGIIYSDGTETKGWANEPDGTSITVACNTPIVFYYPMGDEAPNVTITTEGGVTLQATRQSNYGDTIYSIPSQYKNTRLTIAW